jgi:hypothetical protein
MAKRTRKDQSKHDAGVQASVNYYRRQGYNVEADLPGHDRPGTINGRRPDIRATKGRREVIVEVETPESKDTDSAQQNAFRRYADGKRNVRFRTKTTK